MSDLEDVTVIKEEKDYSLLKLIFLTIFIGGMFAIFVPFILKQYSIRNQETTISRTISAREVRAQSEVCDITPPLSRQVRVFDPKNMIDPELKHGSLSLVNSNKYPILIYIGSMIGSKTLATIYIDKNDSAQVQIPVGHYRLQLSSGMNWCNTLVGFAHEPKIEKTGPIEIVENDNLHMGITPADVMSVNDSPVNFVYLDKMKVNPPVIEPPAAEHKYSNGVIVKPLASEKPAQDIINEQSGKQTSHVKNSAIENTVLVTNKANQSMFKSTAQCEKFNDMVLYYFQKSKKTSNEPDIILGVMNEIVLSAKRENCLSYSTDKNELADMQQSAKTHTSF